MLREGKLLQDLFDLSSLIQYSLLYVATYYARVALKGA